MNQSNNSRRGARLKEKEKVNPASSDVGRLFRSANAELAVVNPHATRDRISVTAPGSPRAQHVKSQEETQTSAHLNQTRTGTAPDFTRSNARGQTQTKTIAPNLTKPTTPATPHVPPPKAKNPGERAARSLLVISVVALAMWFLVSSNETGLPALKNESLSATQQAAQQARADFYRKITGWKINRERIDVDIDNQISAPALNDLDKKVPAPDIMRGLPLEGEAHSRMTAHDRSIEPRASDLDQQVMSQVREQETQTEIDRVAQAEYIREFIANARRGGYDVNIDPEGNVSLEPSRAPAAQRGNHFHP